MNWIQGMNKCTGPAPDRMTPSDRALHYIRWHTAAYGAPAPMDEIADLLHKRHGLTETQSHDLLVRMRQAEQIAYTGGTTLPGWHEVTPNDLAKPPGAALCDRSA